MSVLELRVSDDVNCLILLTPLCIRTSRFALCRRTYSVQGHFVGPQDSSHGSRLIYDADYVAKAQNAIRNAGLDQVVSVVDMSVYDVQRDKS